MGLGRLRPLSPFKLKTQGKLRYQFCSIYSAHFIIKLLRLLHSDCTISRDRFFVI